MHTCMHTFIQTYMRYHFPTNVIFVNATLYVALMYVFVAATFVVCVIRAFIIIVVVMMFVFVVVDDTANASNAQ